jgi:metal-responsive CopG/Arc/MetJ family transcriptional regulator
MIYKTVILVFTTITLCKTQTQHKVEERVVNCGKYAEDWRIAQCASSLKKDQLITKYAFNNFMDQAKAVGTSSVQYYSIGFTTGAEHKLVAGRIDDPKLKSGITFSYSPKGIYFDKKLMDLGHAFSKPVALYLVNEVEGYPEWNSDFLSTYQASGHDELYATYQGPDAGPVDLSKKKEACGEFQRWVKDNIDQKMKGVAILFGTKHWCPVLRDGVMEMVVAETHEIEIITLEGKREKMQTIKSAVWQDGKFGEPTPKMLAVFQ